MNSLTVYNSLLDSIIALSAFSFVSSITPGPNNLLLATSGLSFGFKRTIPHMLGVPTGFTIILILCALGVGQWLLSIPYARLLLNITGSTYLIYLTWNLNTAVFRSNQSIEEHNSYSDSNNKYYNSKPMSFLQSTSFQFSNPKAWLMAIVGVSLFIPDSMENISFGRSLLIFCTVFCFVNIICISIWTFSGSKLRNRLHNGSFRFFMATILSLMCLYTIASIWMM
ncbi:MAG: LysE family translocator [Cellvibrionaceae bacterium]